MAGDTYWSSVSLLLHGDGTNGSTTFTDNATTPKTITRVGAPTISTAQSKFGGASMIFNGTSDALSIAHHTELNLYSGDFTIEAWVYCTSFSTSRTVLQKDQTYGSTFPSYALRVYTNGSVGFLVGTGNSAGYAQEPVTAAGLVALNTWSHIACTRSGTTLRIFIDGVLSQTATQTGSPTDGGKPLIVGRYPAGGGSADGWWAGHIDELRITKGVARYTATFTPMSRAYQDGLGEVEGVVRDDANALCARTVRLIRRDTGALLGSAVSDASTGAYRIATPTLDEVQRIVLDDSGGTLYNDIIDRVIPD